VAETQSTSENSPQINLKDPALAAFLAWLVPGLGHWYQGRRAKAVLFFVCIMGIFGYGIYLGSDKVIPEPNAKIGYGRAVYFTWNDEEWRMHFFCQVGVGLPTLPAIIQAIRVGGGKEPIGSFMAPPRMENPPRGVENAQDPQQPTLHQLHRYLGYYFELSTTYTEIGGLLNILVIYDAFAGPVLLMATKKEEEDDKKKKEEKKQS
jgi:hypothetical protein